MITIDIAKDFDPNPGFRTYDDGPFSGEEFFDVWLKPKFQEALEKNVKLKIVLDGAEGYASSFLNEAFRLLSKEFGKEESWNRLVIVSNEIPKYIQKIKDSIYE